MRIKRYFTTVMRIERYPFCARRCLSKKRKRNWERIEWFTRSKLIVLVCLRTAMVLFAFNSIAPRLSLISNFVSAHRLLRRACSLRNQIQFVSKASAWNSYDSHNFFTTLTPNGLTRQIRKLFPWRYMEFIPKNASSSKGGLSSRVAWRWKFWISSVHVICARLVDRSNYGPFSKSAPLRDPTSSPL